PRLAPVTRADPYTSMARILPQAVTVSSGCRRATTREGRPGSWLEGAGGCGLVRSVGPADRFDLEGDLDLVADHDASALERHVEGDAEIVPADLAPGRESHTRVAERRLRQEAVELEDERHRSRHAVERELAVDDPVVAVGPDPGR